MSEQQPKPAFREIRAVYDAEGIIVYQAFNAEIAKAAVETQRLDASPLYRTRMTWIKPSWCWMLYRSGYSYKDANQSNTLAIKVSHEGFKHLLSISKLDGGRANPLDMVRLGIPSNLIRRWIDEWIVGIEDVTERARELRRVLDEEERIEREELVRRGLVLEERVYEVSED
ncbi:hypothetical protein FKW77_006056 [Venturia effusa]|uniref:DUF4291 domain-containing protein n=1 Tax=Venturia effusa TaxID=50376 RepID=A0A517LCG6_9PEZI|nr:hypothetical protein FKW77_006056 [Venturia effusa]